MNTQELAKNLLQYRHHTSQLINARKIHDDIGSDAMQEALQRRWLIPNELGYLQVSQDMARVTEMRDTCEKCSKCGCADCDCEEKNKKTGPCQEGRNAAMAHAGLRNVITELRRPDDSKQELNELLSPGTGHDPNAGASAAPAMPPQSPASPTEPAAAGSIKVGDEVMVAEDGQTYTGRIASTEGDRYKLTFGNERPRNERDYAENELRPMTTANA